MNNLIDPQTALQLRNKELEAHVGRLENMKADSKQSAEDTRILVKEVAERHDIIQKLRVEVNELEEKLKQMDARIQFKDEIIKDMRARERIHSSKVRLKHVINQTM